jgi:hypothetical protein
MDVLTLLFYGDNSALLWTLSCEKAIRKNAISLHRGGAECELEQALAENKALQERIARRDLYIAYLEERLTFLLYDAGIV